MKNPYEVLGLSKGASDADIKAAYRKLVIKYHPDKNGGDKSAEEKFKEISNAYDILKDAQKKAAYDQFGEAAFGGGGANTSGGFKGNPFGSGFSGFGFNMGDVSGMMDEVLRGFGFGSDAAADGNGQGRDMLHEITVSLEEAYSGTSQTIRFSSHVKCEKCGGHGTKDGRAAPMCKTCHGTGYVRGGSMFFTTERPCPDCRGLGRVIRDKCVECGGFGVVMKKRELEVRIPAGIEDGARLRLAGQGEAAPLGGPSGDFFIDVHVRQHSVFKRSGRDLYMNADIPFVVLALGGEFEVRSIDGAALGVKIAAGTQIGERLRVKGRGMPGGDLYIAVGTAVPKKLSAKQKKALSAFADN
ncbi:MAG: molecular chaperone DnaJ [Rickettsiales bacterium]|jgi:molecular chaperone DnaJ|nr:molecular chaperone DnaJ [Rickettsiales bacterium]